MEEYICSKCLSVALPKKIKQGSKQIEIICWMFFPFGLPYTIWRMLTKKNACRSCESQNLVSINTPVGKKLLDRYFKEVLQMEPSTSLDDIQLIPSQPKTSDEQQLPEIKITPASISERRITTQNNNINQNDW